MLLHGSWCTTRKDNDIKTNHCEDKENESKLSSISTRTGLGMNLNVFYV